MEQDDHAEVQPGAQSPAEPESVAEPDRTVVQRGDVAPEDSPVTMSEERTAAAPVAPVDAPKAPPEPAPRVAPIVEPLRDPLRAPIRIALTEEELARVLLLIGAPGLPGFKPAGMRPDLSGVRSDDERIEAATRSLVARGLLKPPTTARIGDDWRMSSVLVSLVGACAFAESTTRLSLQRHNSPHEVYLYRLESVAVLRTMPLERLHVFTYIGSHGQAIASAVAAYLRLGDQPQRDFPRQVIVARTLQRVRELAVSENSADWDRAVATLRANNWDARAATYFCQLVREALVFGIVAVRRVSPRAAENRSLALIVASETIFRISDVGIDGQGRQVREPTVAVESIRARDVIRDLGTYW